MTFEGRMNIAGHLHLERYSFLVLKFRLKFRPSYVAAFLMYYIVLLLLQFHFTAHPGYGWSNTSVSIRQDRHTIYLRE